MPSLPDHITPAELAEHLGASERTIRETARRLGTCRIIGKQMIMLPEDLDAFMEGIKPCPSSCTDAGKSGTTQGPLPEGDFEALQAHLKKPKPRGSRQRSSTKLGSVVSMDRARG